MNYPIKLLAAVAFLLMAIVLPVGALQAQNAQSVSGESTSRETAEFGFGKSVSAEILDQQSGGQGTSADTLVLLLSDMKMEANTENNVLNSADTGSNYLAGNAFADSNGLNTVFQVTGNMNILQSSYIINVTISH